MKSRTLVWLILTSLAFTGGTTLGWTTVETGIEYQEFYLPDPNNVFVARMDRTNENCIIESSIAQGGLVSGKERTSGQASRYDDALAYWGQDWGQRNDVVVAINGDFHNTTTGVPAGGQIHAGWFAKATTGGFVWTLDRAAFISSYYVSTQRITYTASGSTQQADGLNVSRGSDELIVYTPQYDSDTNTDNSGVEVLVEMGRPTLLLLSPDLAYGYVRQIRQNQGSTPIPFDHIVLSATGSAATTLLDNVSVGSEIGVRPASSVGSWEKAYANVAGGEVFLRYGAVMGGQMVLHPRTAIAYNDDYIFFVVVDGRSSQSIGMNMVDLGNFCKDYLGAKFGINQDGGGSSTMVVNGVVMNDPSDGSERYVANGMMMVLLQPKLQSNTFETGDQVELTARTDARLGPGSQYASLGSIAKNTQGVVLDHSLRGIFAKGDYWWKGDYGGITGWITEDALTLVSQGNLPSITQHPSDPHVCRGESAPFNVSATGTGTLTYQWQVNGADVSDGADYSGASTSTLMVLDVNDDDVASYRCVVTDDNGSTTSYSAPFTLQAETIITQQPQSQTAYPLPRELDVTFTVAATGEGTIGYRWKKNDIPLSDDGHYSGVTTSTLTIHDVDSNDAGSYRCLVMADCEDVDSQEATLTIISADFDGDLDADLADFSHLQTCMGSRDVQQTDPDCADTDLNGDGLVNYYMDVVLFESCVSGAYIPMAPGC